MNTASGQRARVLGPREGEILGTPETVTDRFMIGHRDTDGRFALVEHRLAPHTLAAPLHLHALEDEYSYVLEGRVGALLGDQEVSAQAGDLIFKPRGQWHTFWNAGDEPAGILELISPGGLEELFREMGTLAEPPDPETIAALAARYSAQVDFEGTMPILDRHGLAF